MEKPKKTQGLATHVFFCVAVWVTLYLVGSFDPVLLTHSLMVVVFRLLTVANTCGETDSFRIRSTARWRSSSV